MAIFAQIAANINTTQTGDFYFTIVFETEGIIDIDGFTLSNIEIIGSTHVSLSDLILLTVDDAYAIIAVNLPKQVSGSFQIGLIGTVSIDGVAEIIDYQPKTIEYDSRGVLSDETYDTTSPSILTAPTKVELRVSAASINNNGQLLAEVIFDYDVPYFDASYLGVSVFVGRGAAVAIDDVFRHWVVPLRAPTSGEGAFAVWMIDDALGFPMEGVRVEVQHAPSVRLNMVW